MDKTLGQIAFEAAKQCPALMLDTLAPWGEQRPDVRAAWQAAADAAVYHDQCRYWRGASDPERKVIEAARREVEKWKRGGAVVPVSIVDAVEALDALEKP